MAAGTADPHRVGELSDAIESDVGMAIATLRLANSNLKDTGERVGTVPEAVMAQGPVVIVAIAKSEPTFSLLDPAARSFEWFRLHALSVQRACAQLVRLTGGVDPAQLAVASLLHDVGALVIAQLWPERDLTLEALESTPEERVDAERSRLHLDHALVGGVLTRRWKLPAATAAGIEGHHSADAEGLAAHIALGDMIAHYGSGDAVDPVRLTAAGQACGLGEDELRELLLSTPGDQPEPRGEECPLSPRELEVIRAFAEGESYEETAEDLQLSTSTIRSHAHSAYTRMGVSDRAQAVIQASKLGWI